MSIAEFEEYVRSKFGQDLFNLSDAEILEIICIYKLFVSLEDKRSGAYSWAELSNDLGLDMTGKQLANKALSYIKYHPKYVNDLKNKFNSPIDVDSYRQQTQLKDLLNDYRKLIREDARIDALKDAIKEAAKTIPTYVTDPFVGEVNETKAEAIILLSDWHIGCVVNNFYNKYNSIIANKELDTVVDEVIDYCKKFNVYKLNVINMGDLIHGGIHTNARVEQEFDVVTQIEVAGQLLYKCLSRLESAAPIVTYRSCSDNHARLMANKSEHIEKENFGRLIDWWVGAKLEQGNHNVQIINDNLDFGLGKFDLLNGKKVMFAHGHEDPINLTYQNFTGATKEFIDYILLAHFHNPKEKAFQDCKVIVNGSLVGTEQYALSRRLFTTPCQKLLIFDNNFIDITINGNSYRSSL